MGAIYSTCKAAGFAAQHLVSQGVTLQAGPQDRHAISHGESPGPAERAPSLCAYNFRHGD